MLEFGFGAYPENSLEEIIQTAQLGETLGYDVAWVLDQTFYRDPFVMLALSARATHHIRLMLGVTNPFTRHPVQVARAAATIDEASGGRLSIAYGAGNRKELILPLGLEQTKAGPRCREAVIVTKQLLAGEEVRYRSDTLVLDGVKLLTPTRPRLPIYLAGRGPYILQAGGEVADGVIIGGLVSQSGIEYALDQVYRGATNQGRNPKEIDIIWWGSCYLTDGPGIDINKLKSSVGHIIGGAPIDVLRIIGLEEDRIQTLKNAYTLGGPAGVGSLVTDYEIDLLAIVGNAKECSRKIARLASSGVNQVGLLLNQRTSQEQEAFLKRFAQDVISDFR